MTCNLWWLLIFVTSIVALALCGALGLLHDLWAADNTRISFIILALYMMVSPFVGWLTSAAPPKAVTDYRQACRYAPELMVGLGMLGTVIGFLQMLGLAFTHLDPSNLKATQAALSAMASGISVALLTTLVGLACSMPLQLQLVNLDIARRR
jgi:uncharacterized membrane protein YfcA